MEYVWRNRTRPELERLESRGRRCRAAARDVARLEVEHGHHAWVPAMRVSILRSAEWAEERARAVALTRADVVATCNQRWRKVACGCARFEFRVGCDQPQLCGECRRRHSVKWWQRIARGMETGLRAARDAWQRVPGYRRRGMLPGIYLITLTGPHSGDMATDRERLAVALRKLLKHANKFGWWSTYALTWEATGGKGMGKTAAGDGHVHIHLAVISSWVPFRRREIATDDEQQERWDSESPNARAVPPRVGRRQYTGERGLHDVWQEAMPGAIQPDVSPPIREKDAYGQAQAGGSYLAKYVTKGVSPDEFTGAKAGELLVAFRNKRKVSTSASFWRDVKPKCDCCGEDYRAVEAPCSLQDIAPGAVLRSHVARRMWLGIQEQFPPWMHRQVLPPPLVVEAKPDKRNAPTRWAGLMN